MIVVVYLLSELVVCVLVCELWFVKCVFDVGVCMLMFLCIEMFDDVVYVVWFMCFLLFELLDGLCGVVGMVCVVVFGMCCDYL